MNAETSHESAARPKELESSAGDAAGSGSESTKTLIVDARKLKSINTQEFLEHLRSEARQNLLGSSSASDERDVDYMLKLVHGLIAINTEIWERCKDHMVVASLDIVDIDTNEEAEEAKVRMMKLSYEKARVKGTDKDTWGHSSLNITAQVALSYKDFGPPPSIPSSLTNIIAEAPPPPCMDGKDKQVQVLLDYEGYIERASLLQDGVLTSFLQKLQTHLEEVQYYVGEIEEWLTEPQSVVAFLNDLFDKDLKVGCVGDNWENDASTNENATCINCFTLRSSHTLCQRIYNCSNNSPGRFYDSTDPDVLFKASRSPGSMELTFDLHTEDGRAELKSFYTFVERFNED
eukprot:520783_1